VVITDHRDRDAPGQRRVHAAVALAADRGVAAPAEPALLQVEGADREASRMMASTAAWPWSFCAPTTAKKISVDSTLKLPPSTSGLPKSAMLSMKPSRKALASPGASAAR
jgi:hypothetical protein